MVKKSEENKNLSLSNQEKKENIEKEMLELKKMIENKDKIISEITNEKNIKDEIIKKKKKK